MKIFVLIAGFLLSLPAFATLRIVPSEPSSLHLNANNNTALCATARETLAYLNKGPQYDPQVIHSGKVFAIPLERVKATLVFICQHAQELQDPNFVTSHFDFYRWYPDQHAAQQQRNNLAAQLPNDKILMTKYYVHKAVASHNKTPTYPFAIYALPKDETRLTLDQANARPNLTRFQYGKQAILRGALANKDVPVLAYVNRDDLEAALLQGTIIADFGREVQTFNVHRTNNIPYNRALAPSAQDRYWYFKAVNGIKGYGKDADHKITVNSGVTFAADLQQFGLGKLLLIQYTNKQGQLVSKAGVLADTGGAFANNLYQVDFLTGSYAGKEAFYQANKEIPDYVTAYFMVLKKNYAKIN